MTRILLDYVEEAVKIGREGSGLALASSELEMVRARMSSPL